MPLGNGEDVGAVKAWGWPIASDILSPVVTARIQEKIAAAPWLKSPQSPKWAGKAIAEAMGLDLETGRLRIRDVLRDLLAKGFLKIEAKNNKEGHVQDWIVSGKPAPQDFEVLEE